MPETEPQPHYPRRTGNGLPSVVAFAALAFALTAVSAAVTAYLVTQHGDPNSSQPTARSTRTILMAVRDVARLETNELHMEKVIDLTDRQSRFFGLVATTDAILLVAAGDVTVGVDLSRLTEHDLEVDRATHEVRLTLPAPEVLSVRLDETRTHVFRRATDLLA